MQPRPELLSRQLVIGRAGGSAENQIAMLSDVLVERHLRRTLAPAPPSLTIAGLIDHDSENPGSERGLTAEPVERPENPHEHFLGQIEGLFAIAKQMSGESENKMVMLEDQLGAGSFIARDASLDQSSFGSRQFWPAEGF